MLNFALKEIMTLMIVEDNLNFRSYIKNLFKENFSDIYETSSGKEAVEKYKTNLPDIVFMDVNIEELDGIKATKKILSEYPLAKIVMVSKYIEAKIRKAAKDAGDIDYVDISKLFEVLNKHKEIL